MEGIKIEAEDEDITISKDVFIDMLVAYDRDNKKDPRLTHLISNRLGISHEVDKRYRLVWSPFMESNEGRQGSYYYQRKTE